ncbi:MAG: pro-sigmaK processing inhibitor BofA family protein [Bacilli bacterium]|nr:pro-sigmaK processing inhibitor BofA family protein [Bacilli bacterium]
MKTVIKIIRKIVFAFILLYTYNLVATSYNIMIPINFYTLGIVSFLDIPGLATLVAILKIFYWR